MNEEKKLKPVIFVKGKYSYHAQDLFKQNLLLKALQVTTDPIKLRQMIGAKTVAEVYRTLDKIAIRREYHEALARSGLDLDTIVDGIKKICETGRSDAVKLRGWQTLLKSLGLEKYEEKESAKEGWQDTMLKMIEKDGEIKKLKESDIIDYEVLEPIIPEEEIKKIEAERDAGKNLYE